MTRILLVRVMAWIWIVLPSGAEDGVAAPGAVVRPWGLITTLGRALLLPLRPEDWA